MNVRSTPLKKWMCMSVAFCFLPRNGGDRNIAVLALFPFREGKYLDMMSKSKSVLEPVNPVWTKSVQGFRSHLPTPYFVSNSSYYNTLVLYTYLKYNIEKPRLATIDPCTVSTRVAVEKRPMSCHAHYYY